MKNILKRILCSILTAPIYILYYILCVIYMVGECKYTVEDWIYNIQNEIIYRDIIDEMLDEEDNLEEKSNIEEQDYKIVKKKLQKKSNKKR